MDYSLGASERVTWTVGVREIESDMDCGVRASERV